jgi:hypothetical protein
VLERGQLAWKDLREGLSSAQGMRAIKSA